jgi:hypothetical protein
VGENFKEKPIYSSHLRLQPSLSSGREAAYGKQRVILNILISDKSDRQYKQPR